MSTTATQFASRGQARADVVPSGIPPIDQQLYGLVPGRTYVLSGAPGTGKSVACLQFLAAALNAGERAAILTQDDPEDVLSQSEFLSLDLMNAVESEQLILLRFQLDFSRRFSRAPTPDAAFTELRNLLGADAPTRLVIDSVVPFIDGGSSASSSAVGMLQLLDDIGSTSLVTYPGDLAGVYDRRLDPLVQRAAAIFHFSADRQRHRHIEIRKVRYRVPSVSPIPYRIEPGIGVVPALEDVRWQQEDHASSPDRQRLVLDLPASSAQDALRLLQGHYNVKVMNGAAPTRPTPIKPSVGGPDASCRGLPRFERARRPSFRRSRRRTACTFRSTRRDSAPKSPRSRRTIRARCSCSRWSRRLPENSRRCRPCHCKQCAPSTATWSG